MSSEPRPPSDTGAEPTVIGDPAVQPTAATRIAPPADPAAATAATAIAATGPATAATLVAGGGDPTAATLVAGGGDPTAATRIADGPARGEGTAPTQISAPGPVTMDPSRALEAIVGQTVGGCRIERLLGKGGMGAVYLAQQLSLHRQVALKVMLPDRGGDAQFADRFVREARLVAVLNHPHVVQVYDAGRDKDVGGMLYMVMEFVSGRTVGQLIRDQGALPPPLALALARQAAEGLQAAHEQRLVHRDIKPDNLMVDGAGRMKVMDFGLARPNGGGGGDSALTQSGVILGTPNYISPEAARGEPTDIRSDLYSLGVALWQMIAGRLPFTAPTPVQVMAQHLDAEPPDLATAAPGCPAPVAALVARLLAKQPANRYPDPAALVRAIDDIERCTWGGPARLRWDGKRLAAETVHAPAPVAGGGTGHRGALILFGVLAACLAVGVWIAVRAFGGTPAPAGPTAPAPVATSAGPAAPGTADVAAAADTGANIPLYRGPVPERPEPPTPAAISVPPAATSSAPATPPAVAPAAVVPVAAAPVAPSAPAVVPAPVVSAPAPAVPVVAAPAPAVPVAAPSSSPAAPAAPAAPAVPVAPPAPALPLAILLADDAEVALPQPRQPGSLSVTSVPPGTEVWVDGVKAGLTPTLVRGLAIGVRDVRLVRGGAVIAQGPVVVAGGAVARIAPPFDPPARLSLSGLPAGAVATAAGFPYQADMAVPTGEVVVEVRLADGATRRYRVETRSGANAFALP